MVGPDLEAMPPVLTPGRKKHRENSRLKILEMRTVGEKENCRRGRSWVLPPENFKRTSTVKHLLFWGWGGSDTQMRDKGRLKGPLSYQYQKETVK